MEEPVRITVTVSREVADKIDNLADRMGASQSKMASWLLEAGLEDHEWIIKVVTSQVMRRLKEGFQMAGKKKKKPAT